MATKKRRPPVPVYQEKMEVPLQDQTINLVEEMWVIRLSPSDAVFFRRTQSDVARVLMNESYERAQVYRDKIPLNVVYPGC